MQQIKICKCICSYAHTNNSLGMIDEAENIMCVLIMSGILEHNRHSRCRIIKRIIHDDHLPGYAEMTLPFSLRITSRFTFLYSPEYTRRPSPLLF